VGVVVLLALRRLVEGGLVECAIARVFAGTGIARHLSSSLSAAMRGNGCALPVAARSVASRTYAGIAVDRAWLRCFAPDRGQSPLRSGCRSNLCTRDGDAVLRRPGGEVAP